MKTVKNISHQELSIPDIGIVKVGETVTVPDDFHNANFEVVRGGISKDETKAEETNERVSSKKNNQ